MGLRKMNDIYIFNIDLTNIEKRGKINKWHDSIGRIVHFNHKLLSGDLKLIEVLTIKNAPYLIFEYNNVRLNKILATNFLHGKLYMLLIEYIFHYNIGDTIKNDEKDIVIIDRKRINGVEHYKIKCNKCGYNSSSYYIKGIYYDEYWVSLNNLKQMKSCPVCNNSHKMTVHGINDITTIAPWMIPYFQDGYEEAKKYSCYTDERKYFVCQDCNRIMDKDMSISNLYAQKDVFCICKDHISYPNKFIFYTFKQLSDKYGIYFQREWSPSWAEKYLYDSYFEYNDKKYIVEMDGALGHGKEKFKSREKDTEGLKRDTIKNELAKKHDINMIRIDATKSNFEYIKNNVIQALSPIFDLSIIKWDIIEKNITKNLIKEVCLFYDSCHSTTETMNEFELSRTTICRYLHFGTNIGWCFYDNKSNITCENAIKKTSKVVYVYDINGNYINNYKSISDLSRKSLYDFGISLNIQGISRVCKKDRKQYKGYIFSYIPLESQPDSLLLYSSM